jgi:hypothetical protein
MKKRRYTAEFKKEAAKMIIIDGTPVKELSVQLRTQKGTFRILRYFQTPHSINATTGNWPPQSLVPSLPPPDRPAAPRAPRFCSGGRLRAQPILCRVLAFVRQPPRGHPLPHPPLRFGHAFGAPSPRCRAPSADSDCSSPQTLRLREPRHKRPLGARPASQRGAHGWRLRSGTSGSTF